MSDVVNVSKHNVAALSLACRQCRGRRHSLLALATCLWSLGFFLHVNGDAEVTDVADDMAVW